MPGKTKGLTTQQIQQFHTDGFLVVEDVIGPEMLTELEAGITAEIDRLAAKAVAEGELSQEYADLPFDTRLTAITKETPKVIGRITDGALAIPAIFRLISYGPLLDVAESLCGAELIASSVYRLRPKLPDYGPGVVPWHQDSGYFEPFCDDSLIVTCWVPLVDANAENGCLQAIRGGHLGPVVKHGPGPHYLLQIKDEDLPEGEIVTLPVKRGSVLLLTNLVPHCSIPNVSGKIRWSMDLRYQSALLPTNAPITRLPEEIMETDAPLACYPPEADVLVRSQKRPEQVIATPEAFERIRLNHIPGAITERWGDENLWRPGGKRWTGHELKKKAETVHQ